MLISSFSLLRIHVCDMECVRRSLLGSLQVNKLGQFWEIGATMGVHKGGSGCYT